MSDHIVDDATDAPFSNKTLAELISTVIRPPDSVNRSPDGLSWVFHYNVDLTTNQTNRLADLVSLAKGHVILSLTEFDNIKAVRTAAKAYLNLPSPTLAQTNAAVAGIIRILGAIFRD